MDAAVQIILSILGIVGGLTGTILFYRSNRRIKDAEATEAEINALKAAMEELRKELERISDRLKATEQRLYEKDKMLGELYRTIEAKEEEIHKLRNAIAAGYSCSIDTSNCPIRSRMKNINDEN